MNNRRSFMSSTNKVLVNGIWYLLDYNNNKAEVTYGSGLNDYTGSVTIPSSFMYKNTTYSVNSIGDYAFKNSTALTEIKIPISIKYIGKLIFYGCTSIDRIIDLGTDDNPRTDAYSIENNCITYETQSGIKLIAGTKLSIIPPDVTEIDEMVFMNLPGISKINIPNDVQVIGEKAFYNCCNLTTISIGKSITTIGNQAFCSLPLLTNVFCQSEDPPTIISLIFDPNYAGKTLWVPVGPNQTEEQDDNTYKDIYQNRLPWSNFPNINLSKNIDFIDENVKLVCINAGWDLNNDGEISYAEAKLVTSLGSNFSGNTYIKNFTELLYFTGLTSIWGNNASSVRNGAFKGCTGLVSIVFPDTITTIGARAFEGCKALINVSFKNLTSLTEIKSYAFYTCLRIKKFDFSDLGITTFGVGTFYLTTGVTNFFIPSTLTSIGTGCFRKMTHIKELKFPSTITTIPAGCFYLCTGLKKLTFEATTPPTIMTSSDYTTAEKAFYQVPADCEIFVPAESVEDYKEATGWSSRASYIKAIQT